MGRRKRYHSALNNQAGSLNNGANWTGSFVFSAGNQTQQIAPVITLRDSTITANYSNGATVYNSNGLYIENTVLQATGPWQVYSSNTTGNYQGAHLKNIYSESSAPLNPLPPPRSPYAGLGITGRVERRGRLARVGRVRRHIRTISSPTIRRPARRLLRCRCSTGGPREAIR